MNILRRIITGSAILVAASSFASADSIISTFNTVTGSYDAGSVSAGPTTFNFGNGSPQLEVPLAINQFQCPVGATGCVLTGIQFTLSTSIVSSYSVTNQSGSGAVFSINTSGLIDISATQDSVGGTIYSSEDPSHTLTPFILNNATAAGSDTANATGTALFTGTGPGSFTLASTTGADTATSPIDSSLFIGPGTYTVYAIGNFLGSIGGTGFTGSVGGTGTETLDVIYDYSFNNGVPEPATYALMGSALIGLGLLRKRLTGK